MVHDDGGSLEPDGAGPPHDERHDERCSGRVLDVDHDGISGSGDAVHPLHRVTARHAHRRLGHRHRVDALLAHRDLARRKMPAIVRADPPGEIPAHVVERERAEFVHGAEPSGTQRTDENTHGMPWSSDFASRSMSRSTISAGVAPS